jgi:type VI secretion system secreted protein VgrG
MEEEGIFYYFRHEESKYDLVLADADSSHAPFGPLPEVPYRVPGSESAGLTNFISQLEDSYQVDTGEVTVQSYNFETPSTDLKARTVNNLQKDKSKGELYEYGSPYGAVKKGEDSSKVRLQQQKARYRLLSGNGPARGVCVGYLFDLTDAPLKNLDQEYLAIGTRIQFQNNELTSGMAGGETPFSCFFRAIPSSTAFRSPAYTPKAIVRGPQTAVVVGPKGDDIFTDKYGRVKIQFHWDRLGKSDEKSSCMVRVSSAIAGSSFGMVSIPRIGQEVIVDFLEGDPDQPIIVGSVYNDENKLPYELPGNMTQSGIKSRSTTGKKDSGKPSNFNELRFEDKKDSEEFFIQAERNFKRVVKNNDELEVGLQSGDSKDGVGDQTIQIHNNRTVTLKDGKEGNDKLTIEKGDRTVKIEKGSDNLNVKKKISFEAGDAFVVKVGQAKLTMKSSGEITIEGINISIKDGGDTKIDTSMDIGIKAGMNAEIEGGMNVDIKAGMNTKVEGGVNAELKGALVAKVDGGLNLDLKGGAMAKLKGGVTMIG